MKSSFLRGIARLPTRISVCTAPGLSMTMTRRVGGGGVDRLRRLRAGRLRGQLAERALGPRERLLGRHVADDREDRVVGAEPLLVERDQVVAGDRGQRFRRARLRPAVRMEAVDQPVEDDVRQELRVVVADPHPRERLLALALDLFLRERRMLRHVRDQIQAEAQAVLHHDRLDVAQVRAGAGAHRAADRVDGIGDLLGATASSCPGRAASPRARRRPGGSRDPARRRRGR